MDLRTTRLRRMTTDQLRGAAGGHFKPERPAAARPRDSQSVSRRFRRLAQQQQQQQQQHQQQQQQQQPRPRSPPPPVRSRTHILDSLEAAPPVTLATRSCDSSTLRSSSCFSSSSFFFPRRSRALILACGRRAARQPHPEPSPAPRPHAAAHPGPTPPPRNSGDPEPGAAAGAGGGGQGPADGGGWRRMAADRAAALTMMAAPARSGRKREGAVPAEPANRRGEEEGRRAATPPRGRGRRRRGGGASVPARSPSARSRLCGSDRGAAVAPGSGGDVRAGRAAGCGAGCGAARMSARLPGLTAGWRCRAPAASRRTGGTAGREGPRRATARSANRRTARPPARPFAQREGAGAGRGRPGPARGGGRAPRSPSLGGRGAGGLARGGADGERSGPAAPAPLRPGLQVRGAERRGRGGAGRNGRRGAEQARRRRAPHRCVVPAELPARRRSPAESGSPGEAAGGGAAGISIIISITSVTSIISITSLWGAAEGWGQRAVRLAGESRGTGATPAGLGLGWQNDGSCFDLNFPVPTAAPAPPQGPPGAARFRDPVPEPWRSCAGLTLPAAAPRRPFLRRTEAARGHGCCGMPSRPAAERGSRRPPLLPALLLPVWARTLKSALEKRPSSGFRSGLDLSPHRIGRGFVCLNYASVVL